jgi:hypothetical protein
MIQQHWLRTIVYGLGFYLVCFVGSSVHAMVYDNRFWPLYREPFFSLKSGYFEYGLRAVFMGSGHQFTQSVEESLTESTESLPLFRIYGKYDQVVLDRALQEAGITTQSVLRSDMRSIDAINWLQHGKIGLKGGVIELFLPFGCYGGLGASFLIGKVNSHLELQQACSIRLSPGDEQELILANKKIHTLLGLKPPCYSGLVFGDVDLYLRANMIRDYWHKFHHVDMGFNLGVMIPSAQAGHVNNPAFVPVGGEKHWGIYGAFEGTFVLKEDLAVGLLLRVNKRFPRTSIQRMPFLTEPTNFGVLVGPLRVNPGVTVIFEPRFQVNCLRDGLGFNIAYILVYHFEDSFQDKRCDQTVPANLALLKTRSSWGTDYVSATALYDFGYDREDESCAPIISLTVDIPFSGAVAKRASKTHSISLRIESRI